ncbi:hypothetical protein BDB00DRAFT_223882 [Zychaea mexicana]|uniref:uncharacterized protein n=1 Tax=Zychaea mexicana TaxID=64656 RepID=UPI0022FF409E|nr:uncharacterized protein BDB00DRAFT_223882 [Zychaea mexicana]KAI9499224.1 hypothetical protein BDB00DRAFT_223882 [Zychaea mexicana]
MLSNYLYYCIWYDYRYKWGIQRGKLVFAPQRTHSFTSATVQLPGMIHSSQGRASQQLSNSSLSNNKSVTAAFKYGPYFEVVGELTPPVLFESILHMRSNRVFAFMLTLLQQQLIKNGTHEVRVFCSKYTDHQKAGLLEFPEICEIKVNSNSILSGQRLRGIKGSPGTIHPPDITSFIQLSTRNVVEICYASNNSKQDFVACVRFVQRHSVESLVEKLVLTQFLPKEDVLQKFAKNQEEADVFIEFQTLSMKCPLAFSRIQTPIRASTCSHAQCFDAYTFLKMNEQTPTWSCPSCSRPIASFDDLFVDGYFKDILDTVGRNADTVRIGANGELQQIKEEPDLSDGSSTPGLGSGFLDTNNRSSSTAADSAITVFLDDDDEDEVDNLIKGRHEFEQRGIKRHASEEPVSIPSAQRPKNTVIDLTLSDDDDDETEVEEHAAANGSTPEALNSVKNQTLSSSATSYSTNTAITSSPIQKQQQQQPSIPQPQPQPPQLIAPRLSWNPSAPAENANVTLPPRLVVMLPQPPQP